MAKKTRFGVLLKRYRQAAGLSQEALAERAGLSPRAISDLERGVNRAPRYATLELISNALSLTHQQRNLLKAVILDDASVEDEPPDGGKDSLASPGIPIPPTNLTGREKERGYALDALQGEKIRLLTLTGPSGVGKTRLALQLAHEIAPRFADGAVFVPLASIRDAALLPEALAQRLSIRETPSALTTELVQAFLQKKQLLLVLDNLEQVLDGTPFIAELLANCPHLVILATSRSPLRLRSETELLLAPLPLSDATALFIERARAVRPDRSYPVEKVAAICDQLDCLPLAIELAATHVRLLSPAELLNQLADRFALLRAGAYDLPARQQTMEDAIAWSYDLLTEPQQRCFRALGAFVGGWTLEAAEKVCFDTTTGPATAASATADSISGIARWAKNEAIQEEMLSIFAALVEASLVQTEEVEGGAVRFSMLELIREYALKKLHAAGEAEIYQIQHARYFAYVAEKTQAMFEVGHTNLNLSLAREQFNIQAAMQWAEAKRDAELGLRLAGFARLWHLLGQARQAETWQERMLKLDQKARESGLPAAPLSLRIEKLSGLGRILLGRGEWERARSVTLEARRLAGETGDPAAATHTWMTLALIAQAQGQTEEAEQAYLQAAAHSEATQDDPLKNRLSVSLAEIARARGDTQRAISLLEQALRRAESAQLDWDAAIITTLLGLAAHQQQDDLLAKARFQEGLRRLRLFNSPVYIAWCLEGCAATFSALGHVVRAVHQCAAAAKIRQKAASPLPPTEQAAFDQVVANAQVQLGLPRFQQEWEKGAGYTSEQAIEDALEIH